MGGVKDYLTTIKPFVFRIDEVGLQIKAVGFSRSCDIKFECAEYPPRLLGTNMGVFKVNAPTITDGFFKILDAYEKELKKCDLKARNRYDDDRKAFNVSEFRQSVAKAIGMVI